MGERAVTFCLTELKDKKRAGAVSSGAVRRLVERRCQKTDPAASSSRSGACRGSGHPSHPWGRYPSRAPSEPARCGFQTLPALLRPAPHSPHHPCLRPSSHKSCIFLTAASKYLKERSVCPSFFLLNEERVKMTQEGQEDVIKWMVNIVRSSE